MVSCQLNDSAPCSRLSASSQVTKFPVVHPLSIQPLTKCSSRNSFILKTIHFDGGCVPLPCWTFRPSDRSSTAGSDTKGQGMNAPIHSAREERLERHSMIFAAAPFFRRRNRAGLAARAYLV